METTLKAVSIVLKEQISALRDETAMLIKSSMSEIQSQQTDNQNQFAEMIPKFRVEMADKMNGIVSDAASAAIDRDEEVSKAVDKRILDVNEYAEKEIQNLEVVVNQIKSNHEKAAETIKSNELTSAIGAKELLERTEYIGKELEKLDNTLVDVEIYSREQPVKIMDEIYASTKEFDEEIDQKLDAYNDKFIEINARITDIQNTVISMKSFQAEKQDQISIDLNASFENSDKSRNIHIDETLNRIKEEMTQLSIIHKTEIIGDLLVKLKGEKGESGSDGVQGEMNPGPTFTDAVFNSDDSYNERDVVWKDGHAFIALRSDPQGDPGQSDDWAKYAMRGMRGRRGLKGLQGDNGDDGPSRDEVQSMVEELVNQKIQSLLDEKINGDGES